MISRGLQPRRTGAHARRSRTRRTLEPLRSAQVVAAIVMAACLVGMFAVSVAPSFAARTLEIHGATFTSQSIIRSILGMDGTPNVFRIDTDHAESLLVRLPAVESVSVTVRLPSTVVVNIVERQPKLIWVIGDNRFVVDQDGTLFGHVDAAGIPIPSSVGPLPTPNPYATPSPSESATASTLPSGVVDELATPLPTATPTPTPTPTPTKAATKAPAKATPTKKGAKAAPTPSPSPVLSPTPTDNPSLVPSLAAPPTVDPAAGAGPPALGLGVVFDRRASDADLTLGGIVDPVNLDAGYRLAGLTPADVGSTAPALAVVVDDDHGFTVSSVPAGWVGEFGFYAPTVRKTTVIPEQVQTLRSCLLQYGEAHVAWVRLVGDVSENHVNTYFPR